MTTTRDLAHLLAALDAGDDDVLGPLADIAEERDAVHAAGRLRREEWLRRVRAAQQAFEDASARHADDWWRSASDGPEARAAGLRYDAATAPLLAAWDAVVAEHPGWQSWWPAGNVHEILAREGVT